MTLRPLWKRNLAILFLLAMALAHLPPVEAADGYYNGLKLPYVAGRGRIVVRSTSHGAGRHAVDFGMFYEEVLAMYGGRVSIAAETPGEGRYVVVDHGDGYCANYLHLDKIRVRVGQRVQQGEILGISGNTGRSSGPHLHVAVYRKTNAACAGAGPATEVMMLFDELPSRELRSGDWVVSRNGKPTAPYYPSLDRVTSSSILVKWNDYSNNEQGFKVERRVGARGAWAQVGMAGENSIYYQDNGLNPSTQYCYRVRAFNRAGDSTYSNIVCATTRPPGNQPPAVATPESKPEAPPETAAEEPPETAENGAALIYNALIGARLFLQDTGLMEVEGEGGE